MHRLLTVISISLIRLYQRLISPLKPKACRFEPTCSEYAKQALEKKGFWRGMFLSLRRLLKCHPFHAGGYDPLQ